jgi:hypothetical protein
MHNNLSADVTRALLDEQRLASEGRDRLHSRELRRQKRTRWRPRRAR